MIENFTREMIERGIRHNEALIGETLTDEQRNKLIDQTVEVAINVFGNRLVEERKP